MADFFKKIGTYLDDLVEKGGEAIDKGVNVASEGLKGAYDKATSGEVNSHVAPYLEKAEQYFSKVDLGGLTTEEKVSKVITYTSATCGAVALQPFPVADFFLLTPIQVVMVMKIGQLMGYEVSKREAKEVLYEIVGVVGWGLLARTLIVTGYKTFIPFLGGLLSFPLVYGATYALGKSAEYYYTRKNEGQPIDINDFKVLWHNATEEGRQKGEQEKDITEEVQEDVATEVKEEFKEEVEKEAEVTAQVDTEAEEASSKESKVEIKDDIIN